MKREPVPLSEIIEKAAQGYELMGTNETFYVHPTKQAIYAAVLRALISEPDND